MKNIRLSDTIGMKSENLHLMRFIASIMVIISHSFIISTGVECNEWFVVLSNGQLTMGGFAVAVFFLCGGYLIAMSAEKNQTAGKFFKARALRLFPPLVFSTFFTILICGLVSEWGQIMYYTSPTTWEYMKNSIFWRVYYLPGVFTGNPYGPTVNGSLWTLPVEFICYILCFIAMKLKLTKKKTYPFTAPFVIAGAVLVWILGLTIPMARELIRPVLLFYIGMGYWIYRENIFFNVRNVVIAIAVFFLLMIVGQGTFAMLLAFPYIMMYIWFGMKQCSSKLGKLGDYSYGIYLWGFPVQQLVVHFYPEFFMEPVLNAILSIPVAIAFGMITYWVAEKWFIREIEDVKEIGLFMTLKKNIKGGWNFLRKSKLPEWVYLVILAVYPMRHVNWGLDIWDTGYNYFNFQYMGVEHMDPMWLFSTYLANAVGNIMTKLPFGDTLLGMNFYTTLLISALAIVAYLFCTRKIKLPTWLVFIGEFIAINLCWAPSAALYNYVSYLLMLISVIFVYNGIVKEKKWYLFVAGVCLGANVLTRFSNLPQMSLIVAVWAYGFFESREETEKGALKRTVNRTLWCLGGYLTGLGAFLGYIGIRYGIDEYITGIIRLFSMTETAVDYKASTMILSVVYKYVENLIWIRYMILYAIPPILLWMVIDWLYRHVEIVTNNIKIYRVFTLIAYAFTGVCGLRLIRTLILSNYFDLNYYAYVCMLNPSTTFMLLTMLIIVIKVVRKNVAKEEKLIAMMILLMLLVNSVGSNNGVFSSLNNLFLAAPYTIWNCYLFIRKGTNKIFSIGKTEGGKNGMQIYIHHFPFKCMLGIFLGIFLVQTTMFGAKFFFTEASGATDVVVTVDNNELLKGIKMSPEKADWISTITAYVKERDLIGRESLTYGHIPSISYYLQMPAAFNPWFCLGSFSYGEFEKQMQIVQDEIDAGGEAPIIFIDTIYSNDGTDKWILFTEFMETNGYQITFANSRFLLYEPNMN